VALASVIVPARDAAATLPATLDALAAQDLGEPFEVLVVDDGSADATAALARAHPVVTDVLRAAGEGPGAARNRAAAVARGAVLAFTDADCVPAPSWLRAGLGAIAAADVVQGPVLPAGRAGPYDRTLTRHRPSPLFETANLLVRAERFCGFERWLDPPRSKELGEDVWLGWRLVRGGARVAWAPDAVVHHAVTSRGAVGYIAEHARRRYLPELVRRVPELRDALCHRRAFLTRRTARFDLAVAAVAAAAATRRPLALAATAPYLALALSDAARVGRRRAPGALAIAAGADAVGLAALAYGSAHARTVVL
jgi:glycosyltransferase involved in cell wall biosynthesis